MEGRRGDNSELSHRQPHLLRGGAGAANYRNLPLYIGSNRKGGLLACRNRIYSDTSCFTPSWLV